MNDENQELPKADISRLKMVLLYGNKDNSLSHVDALAEIASLGTCGDPLIPLVLDLYRTNRLQAPVSSLVKLYLAIPRTELLEAMRVKGDLKNLGLDENCELLKWGVRDVEDQLLAYIWDNWKRIDPWRHQAVRALAIGGSSKALEMLEVITVELAGLVPEKRAQLASIDEEETDPQILIRPVEASSHEHFLKLLRDSVREMKGRLAK